MTRSSQARPSWLDSCPRCRTQILASNWDRDLGPITDASRRVDPISLDRAGLVTAVILARDVYVITRDQVDRIHIGHTYGEPIDTGRDPAHFSRWATPRGHILLGYAPGHTCGTTLPGDRIDLPIRPDMHMCDGGMFCLDCTPPF